MGVQIITDGYDEIGYFLGSPVDGMEAACFIDTDTAKAAKNFIARQSSGLAVGTLAFTATVPPVLTGLSAYIQTDVPETPEHTIISVVKVEAPGTATASTWPMFYGTYQSPRADGAGTGAGSALYMYNSSRINALVDRAAAGAASSVHQAYTSDPGLSGWHLMVDRVSATETRLEDLTEGKSAYLAATVPRALSTGRYRIGSGMSTYAGTCRVSAWCKWPRRLTDAEVAAFAVWLRARELRRGRVV